MEKRRELRLATFGGTADAGSGGSGWGWAGTAAVGNTAYGVPARLRRAAGKAFRAANKVTGVDAYPGLLPTGEPADNAGAAQRAEAAAHASKCLAALVAVLGVGGGDGLGDVASPDSTLVDIDDVDRVAEECSDGLAIGPQWVY